MKGEHFWLVLIRFKLDLRFQFPVIVFFVCIFKEGRCNDVTIASTSLRSTKRTDNLDACTRVVLFIFCNSQLTHVSYPLIRSQMPYPSGHGAFPRIKVIVKAKKLHSEF